KELITLLNNSHYKKTSDQKILIGYSFSYIFYVGNENILEITDIGNKIRINGIYYDVVERNFSRIKDWYNSL
ncbi:hypothetical protein B1A67_13825, partial [Clostridium botulinum D/C]